MDTSTLKWPAFARTQPSFTTRRCFAVTTSRSPVAVTMKSAALAAWSIGRTSNPSSFASIAFTGSTSVTMTCAPMPRARIAIPRPHQP